MIKLQSKANKSFSVEHFLINYKYKTGGGQIMNVEACNAFKKLKIEYFAALSYKDCHEINSRILEKLDFEPASAILFLLPYYVEEGKNLSVYATSLDYHILVGEYTDRLIDALGDIFPKAKFFGFGDHSPIDERRAAAAAGLGIIGDNGLLINEKYGSYVFVAEILSDIEPELLGAVKAIGIQGCESCGRCRAACPSGPLSPECGECLSAITQRKGSLSEKEISLMQKCNTVWGCDLCQRCCPHNDNPVVTPIEFFHKDRINLLTTEILDSMGEEEFLCRAFSWRKRKTVERNLKYLKY